MVTALASHPLRWQAPQPLWARFGADAATAATAPDQSCPAILRFATDDFIEQALALLARDPAGLSAFVAQPETWRAPMGDAPDAITRAPVPSLVQSGLRARFAARARTPIAAPPAASTLKLYQAAHQRFYLVGASLVCGVHGLPERQVTLGDAEQVDFVLRRLMPVPANSTDPAALREFAYVRTAAGARWQRCDDGVQAAAPVAGEEPLPLFPLAFQDAAGATRTMWSGLVPVGRREEYLGAKVDTSLAAPFAQGQRDALAPAPAAPALSKQARMSQFQMDVAEPWKTLIRSSFKLDATMNQSSPSIGGDTEPAGDRRQRVFDFNLQQQAASWLILLDCADHLSTRLPDVWAVIAGGTSASALGVARQKLVAFLRQPSMPASLVLALKPTDGAAQVRPPAATLADALVAIRATGVRERLEAATTQYSSDPTSLAAADWPPFHFVLAGLDTGAAASGPFTSLAALGAPDPATDGDGVAQDPLAGPVPGQAVAQQVDGFTALFAAALDATTEADAPPLPFALQARNAMSANLADVNDGGTFCIRFSYARRDCGPLHPPLLSAPSRPFKLAGFFDPDAPARPIRISLPLDTSPAGLRKFNRNTAFVMSDMLCGQVQRAKGLGLIDLVRAVLPWPLHKDLDVGKGGPCQSDSGANMGMICSLSIPIITICALILLMIIVSLLDLIFRWLPYFIFCFPLPGFKGKKDAS